MLFNSFTFVLFFLPVCLAGFFLLSPLTPRAAAGWLALASLVFYAWWKPIFVLLLVASILVNYGFGLWIDRARKKDLRLSKAILTAAITIDLGVLAYFKYINFFTSALGDLLGTPLHHFAVILPLGISFFTFTQIAFLVDVHVGKVQERNFLNYVLFVTFFPHLIAGPVLHHAEMMPQFAERRTYRFDAQNFTVGTAYFLMGLMKKVVFADSIAPFVGPVFDATGPLSTGQAWIGALAYTMQIYFDFSGYSDMAIGLALMVNVRLPLNFNSPYQSVDIIEFWRRWHMTLSRFLRDYLYIALGGNRKGKFRRYLNLFLTMLLGGLWHGAGWTFVIWGALHGVYLMINHALRAVTGMGPEGPRSAAGRWISRSITFFVVVIAWVFFRATSVDSAMRILRAMFGAGQPEPAAAATTLPADQMTGLLHLLGTSPAAWIAVLFFISWFLPNSQTLMGRFETWYAARAGCFLSRPAVISGALTMLALICVFTVSINEMRRMVSPFIYFNF